MKINVSPPKYSIPATPEALVLFIKGTIKVQELVMLYAHVASSDINDGVEKSHAIENVTINYKVEGNQIIIISANFIKANRYDRYYKMSIHFLARLVERGFDFNIFIPIYKYVQMHDIEDGTEIELISQYVSAVFVKYDNTIKLLSGWPGSRSAA